MRGLVTAGRCVRLERCAGLSTSVTGFPFAERRLAAHSLRGRGAPRRGRDRRLRRSARSADALDNALAESVIGLFKTELIRRRGPWRTVEHVEAATLAWVDWFNQHRLLEVNGDSHRSSSNTPTTAKPPISPRPGSQQIESPEKPGPVHSAGPSALLITVEHGVQTQFELGGVVVLDQTFGQFFEWRVATRIERVATSGNACAWPRAWRLGDACDMQAAHVR